MSNAFNQLDFERPENNPKAWWPIRNRNYTHNGMIVDKVELYYSLYEVRDVIHTELSIADDGNLVLSEPRTTAFIRTNFEDMHAASAAPDPVLEQAHSEAIRRMRNSQLSFRTTKFYLPEGVTIRTGPFSEHPTQICKVFETAQMDFGEVDENDLPVLHEKEWIKFSFAINRPTDINANVRSQDIDNLASRFGDIGM